MKNLFLFIVLALGLLACQGADEPEVDLKPEKLTKEQVWLVDQLRGDLNVLSDVVVEQVACFEFAADFELDRAKSRPDCYMDSVDQGDCIEVFMVCDGKVLVFVGQLCGGFN